MRKLLKSRKPRLVVLVTGFVFLIGITGFISYQIYLSNFAPKTGKASTIVTCGQDCSTDSDCNAGELCVNPPEVCDGCAIQKKCYPCKGLKCNYQCPTPIPTLTPTPTITPEAVLTCGTVCSSNSICESGTQCATGYADKPMCTRVACLTGGIFNSNLCTSPCVVRVDVTPTATPTPTPTITPTPTVRPSATATARVTARPTATAVPQAKVTTSCGKPCDSLNLCPAGNTCSTAAGSISKCILNTCLMGGVYKSDKCSDTCTALAPTLILDLKSTGVCNAQSDHELNYTVTLSNATNTVIQYNTVTETLTGISDVTTVTASNPKATVSQKTGASKALELTLPGGSVAAKSTATFTFTVKLSDAQAKAVPNQVLKGQAETTYPADKSLAIQAGNSQTLVCDTPAVESAPTNQNSTNQGQNNIWLLIGCLFCSALLALVIVLFIAYKNRKQQAK